MKSELYQKRLFITREITIYDTKVVYQCIRFGKINQLSIPYEELTVDKGNHITQIKHINIYVRGSVYLATISFFFRDLLYFSPNLYLIFIFVFLGITAFHYIICENVWKIRLQNSTYIFVNKKLPNENEVDEFIENLFKQRNIYLKDTYFHISKYIPYEPQFKNLQWLRQIEVIDSKEFDAKRQELEKMFTTDVEFQFWNN